MNRIELTAAGLLLFILISGCGTLKEKKSQHACKPITFEEQQKSTGEEESNESKYENISSHPSETQAENQPSTKNRQKEVEQSTNTKITIDKSFETESIINVIENLEECYKENNFDKWKSFLTEAYKDYYSNPKNLHEEGWGVNTLEEFFNLLVETRKSSNIEALEISRVEFLSNNKALVYVKLKGKEFPKPQHTFIRINGKWYKGLMDEEPEDEEPEVRKN